MENKYQNITISELNILFLESKYNTVRIRTYGTYQDRAKIVNEYLGNSKVKYIDSKKIEEFQNYLLTNRKWKYKQKVSGKTITNIIQYLNLILEKAVFWKIISTNPIKSLIVYKENYCRNEKEFIKERQELLSNIEYKRVSNKLDSILNIL